MKRTAPQRGVPTALSYVRVSKEEQAREGLSLEAQLAECRRYGARQGWVLGREFKDVMKGTRDDRPDYQALLAEVRRIRAEGRPVVVVVAALDRFGRKLLERVRRREELKELGVAVHSVREGGEVSDIVANVLAAVAQEEVRRTGERVRAMREHVEGGGWHVVGSRPWGYRWRPALDTERAAGAPLKVLDRHPDEAPYVREAFKRAEAGESLHAIARWAVELPAAARGGRALSFPAIRWVLNAAVYVGRHQGPKDVPVLERPVGRWPALVGDRTFATVQQRLARHRRVPRQATGRFLLTGLIRCPRCGYRMVGVQSGDRQVRYRCGGRMLGASAPDPLCQHECRGRPVETPVREKVEAILRPLLTADTALRPALEAAWLALQQSDEGADAERRVHRLQAEIERGRKRLADAAIKLVDGELDRIGYEAARQHIEADLEAAENEVARLRAGPEREQLPPLDHVLAQAGGWAAAFEQFDLPAQRDVLALLVDRVVPAPISRGTYDVEVTWTPLGAALRRLAASADLSEVA